MKDRSMIVEDVKNFRDKIIKHTKILWEMKNLKIKLFIV